MKRAVALPVSLSFCLTFALAAGAASLSDPIGRWSCSPSDPMAPLIEIDFGEGEYRRCDQNICSAYEITAAMVVVDSASNMVRIDFAPDARFRADADGRSFTETIRRGPRKYESSGGCVHRGRDAQAHRRG